MFRFAQAFARALACLLATALALTCPRPAAGQAGIAFTQQRPFVMGLIPVVGPGGAVGGVSIDAQGVIDRTDAAQAGRLRDLRLKAQTDIGADLQAPSRMRKVSLRGLVAAIEAHVAKGQPATEELQNLAGLQRIEFVLVYPEQGDIVLAGPAEGWQIDERGNAIGKTTGQAVLQLDDLVVALRSAHQQVATGELITCSIDPTKAGLQRLTRALKARDAAVSEATLARFEQALGPQQIRLTGVSPGSHFAQVLVASDFMMKRLAMGFEPSPIDGLPSYMEMLKADSAPLPKNAMPRWWMAPRYEPLLKDAEGLAWQLRGSGVQTLTEEGFLGKGGAVVARTGKKSSLAEAWADAMTEKYDALASAMPVFAELRNCMDLAVVSSLIVKEDLAGRSGCDLSLLLHDKRIAVAEYHVPKTVASRASLIRKEGRWVVSVSGGVEVDSWSVLNEVQIKSELSDVHTLAASSKAKRWWWD